MIGLKAGLIVCWLFFCLVATIGLCALAWKRGWVRRPLARYRKKVPTFEEAFEQALKEQLAHERLLAGHQVHFWHQQRERAVMQRIEKKMGKVASPTMLAFVRQKLLQVEVVNLSPHKPKR